MMQTKSYEKNGNAHWLHVCKASCQAFALLALSCLFAAGALAYDVEADSVNNKVYLLLINDNPATSYDNIDINNVPQGIVTTASATIVPAFTPGSVAADGSNLASITFDIDPNATLGATGDLNLTVSGTVGGQVVDIPVSVPLEVVSSAAAAQGFVGSTEPSPDPANADDSDGDGVSDALEISFGSNPLDSGSMPGQPGAPFIIENIPMLGALGAAALALLLLGGGSSAARRSKAGLLAVTAVVLLPLDLLAGSATRIQLVEHIPVTPQLLSATATASTTGAAGPASYAADGNIGTRWESVHASDPQWLKFDLGDSFELTEVIIHWEAANAATYEVQGSVDGTTNWITLANFSGGTWDPGPGVRRTDTHTVSGSYQYVRMYGLTRPSGNVYGYSIWEMEVYGLPPSDADGDGVDDSNDLCPNTPAGATVDVDGCEIVDSDNDGVPDAQDQCPNTPAGTTVFANGCPDTDGDGVDDGIDQCPNTPAGTTVDATGCEFIVPVNEVASINGILAGGSGSSQPGYTLYVFDSDPIDGGVSNCNGGCATTWPPLLVNDGVASGVDDLSTIVRNDSTVQAAHNGRPLYFYAGDSATGDTNGDGAGGVWHIVPYVQVYTPLFDQTTPLEPETAYVRSSDGVVVTRFGDRGRDRHAKDIGYYGGTNWDHYDHYLAEYWHYRTARIQIEDYVTANTPQSLIRFTYITENRLGAKEFRAWYYGLTTTGQFHFNGSATEDPQHGRFDDDFNYIGPAGAGESDQYKYTIDVTQQWKDVGTAFTDLFAGVNMEIEISQFLVGPPSGSRLNYYGTSYVYVIGQPGL
ncbi:MAG: discoidin domain-containing protein, partial [Gammaproteobacteria bacterium]|nr:discoidin domain-containing protein [Gammaproteobacteria bacterium]